MLNYALPGQYVPVLVTRCALAAHRYTYAPPRCITSQYHRTLVSVSVSLWNDLADPMFDGVGLAGFKSRANTFLLTYASISSLYYSLPLFFPFSSSCLYVGIVGLGSSTDRVYITLSQICTADLF